MSCAVAFCVSDICLGIGHKLHICLGIGHKLHPRQERGKSSCTISVVCNTVKFITLKMTSNRKQSRGFYCIASEGNACWEQMPWSLGVWLHDHETNVMLYIFNACSRPVTEMHEIAVSQHHPSITPVQLMRPGFGCNVSCTVADFGI